MRQTYLLIEKMLGDEVSEWKEVCVEFLCDGFEGDESVDQS